MLQKKICMLGSFGVGKTSLVRRFVSGDFSERYLSTVGVKLDRKELTVGAEEVRLILWDIHGDDEFQRVRASYLRGMGGYFLVVDGTRNESLSVAMEMHTLALDTVGKVPRIMLINKADLADSWEVDAGQLDEMTQSGWTIMHTSAKTGDCVEEAFQKLATEMVAARDNKNS